MPEAHERAGAGTPQALPPWLAEQLSQLLPLRGHAWLLQAPGNNGQHALALAWAQAGLCEAPNGQGACGTCASCHAVAVHTHADLCVLMPETHMLALGWPLAEKAQQELDDKKRKPSREIRVEALRDAIEFAQRTSARGRGKAVVVYPAERMNAIAANALLKVLEEPPGDVRFILASEAVHQLLPTLRSRCQSVAMASPSPEQAQAWLQAQGWPPAEAQTLLRAGGGQPEQAQALREAGWDAQAWQQLPQGLARGDAGRLAALSPADAVEALQKLCHDLMARHCGATPRFFEAAALPAKASFSALSDWSRELMQTARTADHPFNAGLMLEALVNRARGALNSAS